MKKGEYDHTSIEKKWQKYWNTENVYATENEDSAKEKCYVLDMFPYPSGAGLHVGHPRGYIASDVYARMKRMEGYNVLHPMGFDSFGLPAEQYAIQTKKHPGPFTDTLVTQYRKQLEIIGASYDWDREVATHRPEYYKWTQWIFLTLYNSYFDSAENKAKPISILITQFETKGSDTFTSSDWNAYTEKKKQDILMKYRIAYEGYAEVNWCAELGTVLANDEILDTPEGPVSERGGYPVVKKSMRQWFMRITAYAERLLSSLDTLDWPENIKEIQRNWIGKSEGSEIDFTLSTNDTVSVFTTRADTLFGVTYIVLAPEHTLITKLLESVENKEEVLEYIALASAKNQEERTDAKKEKTGIVLQGITAINPVNGESIPVWISDYVLASYGTGAVMAVPAHDERDFIFANTYGLPVTTVIAEKLGDVHEDKNTRREVKAIIVKNGKLIVCTSGNDYGLPGGGIEENETPEEALVREIREELGYTDIKITQSLGEVYRYYYSQSEQKNKIRHLYGFVVEIVSESKVPISPEETDVPIELDFNDAIEKIKLGGGSYNAILIERYLSKKFDCHTEYGVVVNSGKFSGLSSEDAKKKITEFVHGRFVTKYKMRDAIFARQRYWGEPIPLIHDDGIIKEVASLPLELPNVKSYEPTGNGESPLASVSSWVKEGYETNTMPGWAGSSWYFLRYMDPKNKEAFASKEALSYWKSVDMYVGGAEHATGHLLYSRFWNKALFDLGYVPEEEPFKALRNQGMIGGTDGRKMSKRWGNVINPDDVVKTYGADSLRVFEMFLGPFESHLPWSTDGILGSRRFIERVYRLQKKVVETNEVDSSIERILHKTIKKVTEDIQSFNFNTAVSAMMILLNEMEKRESIAKSVYETFITILAPFAPYITEDIWNTLGHTETIHKTKWPKYDEEKIIEDEVTIMIQVNGKVRGSVVLPPIATEEEVLKKAHEHPNVIPWITDKKIVKIIYVQGKLINIVAP